MTAGVFVVLGLSLILSLVARPAIAAVGINKQISFQGKVVNSDGTNVTNGTYTFVFKIYNVSTGGTALWTETKSLTVTDGIFQTNLGSTTSLPGSVDFNTDSIYLGINFNSDGEMSPRVQFTAVPYSFNSDTLDGIDSAGFAQLNPASAQSGSLNVTGTVQAATSLQAPLLDTPTAGGTLALGTTNATGGINLNQNTSVATGKNLSLAGGNLSVTGLSSGTGNAALISTNNVNNIGLYIQAASGQSADLLRIKDGAGADQIIVNSVGSLSAKYQPSTNASAGSIMVGSTATQTSGNVNGTIGFPGSGVKNAEIAYVVGDGFYLCDSSASSAGGNYGTCSTRVNLYGSAGNFNGGLTVTNGAISLTGNAASSFSTSSGNLTIDSAAAVQIGNTNATSLKVGKAGITTEVDGTTQLGSGAGTGALVNNGSTVNTVYNMGNLTSGGWDAGGAAATVDKYTYITANQTTSGQTLTVPAPTANTTYGRVLYLTNGGNTSFTVGGVALAQGSTATLIWSLVNSVGQWTFAGADGSGILNQNATDQTANFRISGTGRANTSFISPIFDSITGGLSIGTGTATGITLGGTATTGTISIGNSAASTINIGSGAQAHTIAIGTDSTTVQGITIGSTTTGSTTAIQGPTITVGTGGASIFKNNGATYNLPCDYTGVATNTTLNTANKTPDVCTVFRITDTAAVTITVPAPTAGAGSVVYVSNMAASTNPITLLGSQINAGTTATLVYNGTAWTFAGADASGLQTAYNNSTGGTTPEILLDSTTHKGLDVQDSGLGSSEPLLAVRAVATPSTLGSALFTVTNNAGAPLVGIGTNVASRALHVLTNAAQTTSPAELIEQANGSGDAGLEFKNSATGQNFFIGQDTSNGGAFSINSGNASAASPSTITFVQAPTPTTATTSATSISLAFASGNTAGNTIVAVAAMDATATQSVTCSDTRGNSYSTVFSQREPTGNDVLAVCVATNVAAGANTVTATFGASSSSRYLSVHEYSGVKSVSPLDVTTFNIGSTGNTTDNMTSGAVTTSQNGDLIFGAAYDTSASAQTLTAGTGYTSRTNNTTNNYFVLTEDKVQSGAASVSSTWTSTTAGHAYIGALVALRAVTSQGDNFTNSLFSLTQGGSATFRNFANYTNAFQIQNAAANTNIFQADTVNNRIGLMLASGESTNYDVTFGAGANRIIGVNTQTTTNTAGASLQVISAAGNGNGAGGQLSLNAGNGGTSGVGGAIQLQAGNGGGSNAAGGAVTVAGGTANGTGTGGAVTIQGGAASATAGSSTGALTLKTQNGTNGSGATAGGAAGALAVTAGNGGSGTGTNSAGAAGANVNITAGTGGASTGTANNSNGGSITLQAGSAGTGGSGTAGTAGAINLQGNTINAGTAGVSIFKNNGATFNATCAYTGVATSTTLNTASKTPDVCTTFVITTTAGGVTITVPAPAAGAGSMVYVANSSGSTNSFTLLGATIGVGSTATLVYVNGGWSFAGADAGSLQTAYNNQAGGTTPSIAVNTTKAGVSIQNSVTNSLAAGADIFTVRAAAANDTTLGGSLLTVSSYGIGVNLGTTAAASGFDLQFGSIAAGSSRVIQVQNQATANTAGGNLTVQSATGNGSGAGGVLVLNGGTGGTTGAGGAVTISGGTSGGGATNGGAVTVQGGTATGIGTGGALNIKGGAPSATAGSASGAASLSTQNGAAGSGATAGGAVGLLTIQGGTGGAGTGTNSAGAAGGNITIAAGTGGASTGTANNANGGSITLTAGVAGTGGSGTAGVPGTVNIDTPVFIATTRSFTQTANGQTFNIPVGDIDGNSTVVVNVGGAFTGATVTVPSPSNTTTGRIVYITNGPSSVAFTLSPSGSAVISMNTASTATLVWNGSAWTAAGADASTSLQQVYNNTNTAPVSIITTSATKNMLFQAGSGFDNTSLFTVASSSGSSVLTVDTTNSAAGGNVAVNGGGETIGTPPTGWVAHGTATITSDQTAGEFASGSAGVKVATGAAALNGVRNNVGTAMTASTTYIVSFSIKVGTALTNANTAVVFSPTGTTSNNATCSTFTATTNPAINTTNFIKYSCYMTTTATATTASAYLAIYQNDTTARNIFIDNLSIVAQNNTGAQNFADVKVGGMTSQGLTLLTVDSYAAAPFTGAGNTSLLGSMYYDTTIGKMQCYEAKGWGSCGNSPNNSAFLIPEYPNAVLGVKDGSTPAGVGTMTAGLCSGSGLLNINTSLCTVTSEDHNFYKWTSPQSTFQYYTIYVRYQLPATYNGFLSSSTVTLQAFASSITDGSVSYSLYGQGKSTPCGTGASLGSTNAVPAAGSWQSTALAADETSGSINGSGASTDATCNFSANDVLTYKIDLGARNGASVYVSNLTFTTKGL